MSSLPVVNLSDCTEFRQTVESRPPRVVHGTLLLLVAMIGGGVAWANFTMADLVVQGRGRVRPIETPQKVFATDGPAIRGRVIEVAAKEGDSVQAEDVLLRLDSELLDNDLKKLDERIDAAERELQKLAERERLLDNNVEAAKAKTEAELVQAETDISQERERRESERRQAKAALEAAARDVARYEQLVARQAATSGALEAERAKKLEAEETLQRLQLPVNEGRIDVIRKQSAVIETDYSVRKAELEAEKIVKQGELEAARRERNNLLIQKEQAVLRAPIDGVMISGDVKVGDLLKPGTPVFEVARRQGFHFEVHLSSEDVGHLEAGMPARIRFDAYDYQKYGTAAGDVTFISPDSIPAADSQGLRDGRYLVRVTLLDDMIGRGPHRAPVKLGLSGSLEIVTARARLLSVFTKKIRRTISLTND